MFIGLSNHCPMKTYITLLCACLGLSAAAQLNPEFIKDFNTQDNIIESSDPDFLVETSHGQLFVAKTEDSGRELWITDGSKHGTKMVYDINPGGAESDSRISSKAVVLHNNYAYFAAYDTYDQFQIWKSNGQGLYTEPLNKVSTSVILDEVRNLTVYNNQIYFYSNGYLWHLNPANNTYTTVVEIAINEFTNANRDTYGNFLNSFPVYNGMMYFPVANKLYKSDGTENGTTVLLATGGELNNFINYNNRLYFTNDGYNGLLWTDGSWVAEPIVFGRENGAAPRSPEGLTISNGRLYAIAKDDQPNAKWSLVDHLGQVITEVDIPESSAAFAQLIDYNGELYFTKRTNDNGIELWKTDGSPSYVEMIPDNNGAMNSNPHNLVIMNYQIFYKTQSDDNRKHLRKTDGTPVGSKILKEFDINSTGVTSKLCPYNNNLYFAGENPDTGVELWFSDGTPNQVFELKDINSAPIDLARQKFEKHNNKLLFSADDGVNGNELWITDGRAEGTYLLKNLENNDAFVYSYPFYTQDLGDNKYFMTSAGSEHGLWRTDASTNGTQRVKSHTSHQFGSYGISSTGEAVYVMGSQLWVSEGEESNTRLIQPTSSSSFGYPVNPASLNGKFIFMASDYDNGRELWISDGTNQGTYILKDICPGRPSGWASGYLRSEATDNMVFFSANDGTHGVELWASDGTPNGTKMVKELNAKLGKITTSSDYAFFTAERNGELELWRSDGTANGTFQVSYILPSGNQANPINIEEFNNQVVFMAFDGSNFGLYKSDGSVAGTQKLASLYEGYEPTRMLSHWEHNNKFYFVYYHANIGKTEIWESDLTVNGTRLFHRFENYPGEIKAMEHIGNDIVYITESSAGGKELYKLSTATSIVENLLSSKSSVAVFPNPSQDVVQVKATKNIKQVQLLDLSGKLVYQSEDNLNQSEWSINLENYPAGTYFISIIGDNGASEVQKLMLE